MSATDPGRATRLRRIGINDDDLNALEQIWNSSEAFRLIADQRTGSLADNGYSALDSLDAIWHELEEHPAHRYMRHGMTPHQAFLLDIHPQGQSDDPDDLHALLDAPLPLDLRIKILLVAQNPDEAKALTAYCTGDQNHPGGHDFETVIAMIESRADALSVNVNACDCGNQSGPALRIV